MFCPKCARHITDDVQFCPQCGFTLATVRKLLASEGALEKPDADTTARGLSPRRKGIRQGFKLIILCLLLLPLNKIIELLGGELWPSVENSRLHDLPMELFNTLLFVLFAGGLLRMLYARLFESRAAHEEAEDEEAQRTQLGGASGRGALPPAQGVPASEFTARRVDTGDILQPRRSVTEHTTRSLHAD